MKICTSTVLIHNIQTHRFYITNSNLINCNASLKIPPSTLKTATSNKMLQEYTRKASTKTEISYQYTHVPTELNILVLNF